MRSLYFKPGDIVRVELEYRTPEGRRGRTFQSREPVVVPEFYDREDLADRDVIRAVGQVMDIQDGMYVVSLVEVDLAARLFEGMVPELAEGKVRVMDVTRIPGVGSKMTVAACVDGVDPVGAFVGHKGGRVKAIQEILNEKVEVIPYSSDQVEQVRAAIRGGEEAEIKVDLDEGVAEVWLPAHQHGPILGKGGHNSQMLSDLLGLRLVLREA